MPQWPTYSSSKIVDRKGNLNPEWENLIIQLLTLLQQNFSDEGLRVPQLTTAQISVIEAGAVAGTLVFDTASDELKVRLSDGTFHVVQTV